MLLQIRRKNVLAAFFLFWKIVWVGKPQKWQNLPHLPFDEFSSANFSYFNSNFAWGWNISLHRFRNGFSSVDLQHWSNKKSFLVWLVFIISSLIWKLTIFSGTISQKWLHLKSSPYIFAIFTVFFCSHMITFVKNELKFKYLLKIVPFFMHVSVIIREKLSILFQINHFWGSMSDRMLS